MVSAKEDSTIEKIKAMTLIDPRSVRRNENGTTPIKGLYRGNTGFPTRTPSREVSKMQLSLKQNCAPDFILRKNSGRMMIN
jgi:hypothetical protein